MNCNDIQHKVQPWFNSKLLRMVAQTYPYTNGQPSTAQSSHASCNLMIKLHPQSADFACLLQTKASIRVQSDVELNSMFWGCVNVCICADSVSKAVCRHAHEHATSMLYLHAFFVTATISTVRMLHLYSHHYAIARSLRTLGKHHGAIGGNSNTRCRCSMSKKLPSCGMLAMLAQLHHQHVPT